MVDAYVCVCVRGGGEVGVFYVAGVPDARTHARIAYREVGDIFETITTGKGTTMPGYGARISVEDRWAIIHYVRALQSLSN